MSAEPEKSRIDRELIGIATCCTVFLISEFVFDVPLAIVAAALAALNFAWFWYGLPLSHASGGDA